MDEDKAFSEGQGSRTFTLTETYSAAQDAVGLFLEYRDMHGREEAEARGAALADVSEGLHAWADADEALKPHRTTGREEAEARGAALADVSEGLHAWADEALKPHRTTGRDWRALRATEARARQIGLRASVPQPEGRRSPEYQADAEAWGPGRGIGAAEMEREA